ncbi:MAG: translocation/assembly module TamB domain-containing protein, partial [Pseudomonadales bacterium]
MNLRLRSELSGNGLINGAAQIDMRSEGKPVNATLQARFSELTWLDPFLPQLSDLDGDTNIDIQISGTLQDPLIGGNVHMANLTAFVPEAGILLEQGRIDLVNRSAANWDLSASMASGGGNL